jgi:ABC-type polysaccharide/polyol phosphate export permease
MISDLKEAFAHKELLQNLTLRELRTRYRRSILGWGWSLLNPLVITFCYTMVFSVILKVHPMSGHPSGDHYYAFFLMAALLPWNYFANSLVGSTGSVLGAHALISKVYFPRELIVFAHILSLLVTLTIELLVDIILLLIFGYAVVLYVPWLVITMILETLFLAGMCLWLSAASVRSRDIPYLTSLAVTVWFFITPIVWSQQSLSNHQTLFGVTLPLKTLLLANPMARFTMVYRSILWDGKAPGMATLGGLLLLSLAVFAAGYHFFCRRARYFAEEL